MTIYAWRISKPGREDIKKVTTLVELRDYLRMLDLLGIAPPEFVTLDAEASDHGIYSHPTMKLAWTHGRRQVQRLPI